MFKKIITVGFALLLLPFLTSCNEGDAAAGAVVGAVVGGSIVAIAQNNSNDRYYRDRHDGYYRNRRSHYHNRYRGVYNGRNYGRVSRGYNQRRRCGGRVPGSDYGCNDRTIGGYQATPELNTYSGEMAHLALVARSSDAQTLSNFFELPAEVAAIMTDVKNRASRGDLTGLYAIGLDKSDFRKLAKDYRLSSIKVNLVAASLGIQKNHAADILDDLRNEFKAQVAAGRIKI